MPETEFIDTTGYEWVDLPGSVFQDTQGATNVVRLCDPVGVNVTTEYEGVNVSTEYEGVIA